MPEQDVSLEELIMAPVATITAAVGVIGGWFSPLLDPILAVAVPLAATLWAKAGAIFTVTSIGSTTLAPELGWLPAGPLTVAAIATGAVFAATQLWGVYQRYQDET